MPVNVFFVPQVVNLVVPESTRGERDVLHNYPMNRTDFRIVRGTDNLIQFFIRDIDRKPNIIDDLVNIVITDLRGERVLLTKLLTVELVDQALYRATITAEETIDLPDGMLRYATVVQRIIDQTEFTLWTDRNYSPFGYCQVIDGPYPPPVPAIELDTTRFTPVDGWLLSDALFGTEVINGVQTFAFPLSEFTGTVLVEGSLEPQPSSADTDWFELNTFTYDEPTTMVQGVTIEDRVLWLRIRIRPAPLNIGSVNTISYRR